MLRASLEVSRRLNAAFSTGSQQSMQMAATRGGRGAWLVMVRGRCHVRLTPLVGAGRGSRFVLHLLTGVAWSETIEKGACFQAALSG